MKVMFKKFTEEEFGNAVIDWVVLMSGMIMMAIAVVITITDNVETITEDTMDRMEAIEMSTSS